MRSRSTALANSARVNYVYDPEIDDATDLQSPDVTVYAKGLGLGVQFYYFVYRSKRIPLR